MHQGKSKAAADVSDAESVDSMMMDVDAGGSDFEQLDSDDAPKTTAKGRKAAPAKKAPAKGRGKKAVSFF